MRKLIRRLNTWMERQEARLRAWLEALPQRTKTVVVLIIFGVFAACALFSFGEALYRIGQEGERQIEIEHIKQFNLFKYYDYDTEQKPNHLPERGEA